MGATGRAWFPVFFIMAAWYVWVWVVPGFLGKWGGKREWEKTFQKSSSPLSLHFAGEKKQHRAV
jgi:hypothetical protein